MLIMDGLMANKSAHNLVLSAMSQQQCFENADVVPRKPLNVRSHK